MSLVSHKSHYSEFYKISFFLLVFSKNYLSLYRMKTIIMQF